jgi:hypothetical protein
VVLDRDLVRRGDDGAVPASTVLEEEVTREEAAQANEEMLFADGFDDALVGVVSRAGGMSPVALYDEDKCIEILVKRDGMDAEEAREYFDFNTLGAWMGEMTPCFARFRS